MALLALPIELVEYMTEYLDISSFRSFRLVCSLLQEQSLRCFKVQFFRKREVEWTINSLQRLLEISQSSFGTSLEDLVIDATPRLSVSSVRLYYQSTLENIPSCVLTLRRKRLEVETNKDQVEKYWVETRHDFKILTSVFETIRALRSITFAYEDVEIPPTVFHFFACSSQREVSRPFTSTLAAAATANLTVSAIVIDPIRKHGAVSVGRLETISPILISCEEVFLRITVLKLSLKDVRRPTDGFQLPENKPPFWVRFLCKFKNLHTLHLSFCSVFEKNLLLHMAKHCQYPYLESCQLSGFGFHTVDDLLTFLTHAKDALQSLSIDCMLNTGDAWNWAKLWKRLAAEFSLNRLELNDLFVDEIDRVNFGEREGSKCTRLVLEGLTLAEKLVQRADDFSIDDVDDTLLWVERACTNWVT